MSDLNGLVAGLAQGLNGYLGKQIASKDKMAEQQQSSDLETKSANDQAQFQHNLDNPGAGSQVSYITPEMGEKALPGYGGKMVQDYNSRNPQSPMTIDQASDFLTKAKNLISPDTSKEDDKHTVQQDKLEKEYADRLQKVIGFRSGGLGLQDSKVNQAVDLRTLLNQYYDPKTGDYNIPPAQHSELALGLAKMLSPQGTVPIELEKQLRQSTGREALAKALIYMGADPSSVGGPTQSVIKMFRDSIDRQGTTAERLRDQYISGLKGLSPTSLEQSRIERLNKSQLTSSFNDFLAKSPDHAEHFAANPKPGTVVKGYKFMGGDPGDHKNWEKQ